jgi:hypothetical protein
MQKFLIIYFISSILTEQNKQFFFLFIYLFVDPLY